MSFSEYKGYSTDELEKIFEVLTGNLFEGLIPSGNEYPETQEAVDEIKRRFALNEDTNEARRSHLPVTLVLLRACMINDVGAFFDPPIALKQEETSDLAHQLKGMYDSMPLT